MEILQELVQILTKKRLQSLELIGPYANANSKTNEFYSALLENKFETDDEAAHYFYSTSADHSNYKSLKRNLKNRLINSLFFLNLSQPVYNDYEQSYFYCCKYMAISKILIRLQASRAGTNLCEKVFAKARKNEFSDFLAESARFLWVYYGAKMGNLEKFEYYHQEYLLAIEDQRLEALAQEYYVRLMIPYAKEKASKEKTHARSKIFLDQLRPNLEKSQSPYLHFIFHYIEVIECMSTNDYEGTIAVCNKAIAFFETKSFVYKTAFNVFFHNKIACHTQLRQYEEGIALEAKTRKLLQTGTYNWFRDRELFFILSLHTKNYQAAYERYTKAVNHRRFKFLSRMLKETWRIYDAYLHFLVFLDAVVPDENDSTFNNFRLGHFLNSVPVFSKDKRGLNIPILIVQILFMIIKKDYNNAIDRIEAIEKYCVRHVRKNDNYRSNIFIKMLLQIPASGFHKAAIERKSGIYLKQLEASPLEVANQIHELEIIPYEHLWEFVIESLEPKFYRKRNTGVATG